MHTRNPYAHWLLHTFESGDRVIVDGRNPGTVENVFPDGIHMVRLDSDDKVIAVTVQHLKRLEIQNKLDHNGGVAQPQEG